MNARRGRKSNANLHTYLRMRYFPSLCDCVADIVPKKKIPTVIGRRGAQSANGGLFVAFFQRVPVSFPSKLIPGLSRKSRQHVSRSRRRKSCKPAAWLDNGTCVVGHVIMHANKTTTFRLTYDIVRDSGRRLITPKTAVILTERPGKIHRRYFAQVAA